ncbi:Dam family site-specific DNA-(adenine-N6)-methyltransferase [Aestuariibacter halophilus]|uniref:Site-specific DNA-methyltransferase (adenine-specific) n=1 Tax=Fluctibacter halophilus TaxID=226011 RepID=A0ABS8GC36_9ALTE|nr:Dam family site-specific DNA-(adenine-N6)-methyltransferase [Aestuariibacter halophilus]MCC2617385.1 Dam family site-specific DNA-(adenine-N6)-methyltransferase [Aestuariibacter halophilus]
MKKNKHRAFLKWAGGKYGLIEDIQRHLPEGDVLIEPFVGAGSVFLNTDYPHYVLNDINPDLIALYGILKTQADAYIADAKTLFTAANNDPDVYYSLRQEFNDSQDPYQRSLLFLYLNRHGYNGLCRYNLSGKFNVPFGRYKAPYFPQQELYRFAEKAQRATFTCEPYANTFKKAQRDHVMYCDPPYAPISKTAYFTQYAGNGFSLDDQANLADLAHKAMREKGVCVLISNHDTVDTRAYYRHAQLTTLQVKRTISQKGKGRKKVGELLALYSPVADMATADKETAGMTL